MGKKSYTISTIINEVEELASYYENEIKKKEDKLINFDKKIKTLNNELEQLKKENAKLINKSIETKSKNDNHNERLLFYYINSEDYESLEAYISQYPTRKNILLLLRYLNFVIKQDNTKVMESVLYQMVEHIDPHSLDEPEMFSKPVEQFFENLLLNPKYFYDESYDEAIILALNMMMDLDSTPLKDMVQEFIYKHFSKLLENVLDSNYPKIITPFLRVCYHHSLYEHLESSLQQIFTVDWDFLYKSFDDEDLAVVFWFAYLLDLDDVLFDTINIDEAKKLENVKEYKIYFYIKDCESNLQLLDVEKYNHYIELFDQRAGLFYSEKEDVLDKIEGIINRLFKQSNIVWPPIEINKDNTNEHEYILVESIIDDVLKKNNFAWPSTEINEDNTNEHEYALREKSELRSFGYQITGMNREKRWDILKKAVPELGLSKVAYTIAHHVKMRKGQKNGEVTFKHAITEWENDLAQLKETYYHDDFIWPSTDLNRK